MRDLNALKSLAGIVTAIACSASDGAAQPGCTALEIPATRLEPPPTQYVRFCERHPDACRLIGDETLGADPGLDRLLDSVNKAVNSEIELVSDPDRLGVEEDWSFPQNCQGDCEDLALEKRRRLVAAGLPGASLTMAIVHHEFQFFPHAVLLVETDTGTWVLDNLNDEITCWSAVPYRYERRERPDGLWIRYQVR